MAHPRDVRRHRAEGEEEILLATREPAAGPDDEGLSAQIMRIGQYSEEGSTIARMQEEFTQENGLVVNGRHQIYIGDPRRPAREKLKPVLRQPVRMV